MSAQQKMYNFIKRTMVIFAILICVSGATYAQEKADALKLYRTGRSLDSAGRTEEAKTSCMPCRTPPKPAQYGVLHRLYMVTIPPS